MVGCAARRLQIATVAIDAPIRTSLSSGKHDRLFYSGMAIVMAATVFIGFAPTYFLRPFLEPRTTVTGATVLTPLAHVHGALFTTWVLLFIVQTALVASHRTKIHQRLGIAGAVLAGLMVAVGTVTAIAAAARGSAPPGIDPLAFLVIPLFDLVLFALFVAAALLNRRQRETHKRLMLLAYISIIVAAVARLPGVLPLGPLAFFGFAFIFILIGAAYDFASRGRVHPVYLWGGALFVASVPVRLMLSTTGVWHSIAESLTR
jgi:hypothetical protein